MTDGKSLKVKLQRCMGCTSAGGSTKTGTRSMTAVKALDKQAAGRLLAGGLKTLLVTRIQRASKRHHHESKIFCDIGPMSLTSDLWLGLFLNNSTHAHVQDRLTVPSCKPLKHFNSDHFMRSYVPLPWTDTNNPVPLLVWMLFSCSLDLSPP